MRIELGLPCIPVRAEPVEVLRRASTSSARTGSRQSEFGAQLWNGVIFNLAAAGNGLAGTPQAVDLNRIASPPARTDVPPFALAQRDDIPLSAR